MEIEYVSAPLEFELPEAAPSSADVDMEGLGTPSVPAPADDLQRILERFGTVEQLLGTAPAEAEGGEGAGGGGAEAAAGGGEEGAGGEKEAGEGSEDDDEDEEGGDKLSKKKRKMANRLKIADLKQACERPDVVEVWDVTATDPKLLVHLKVGCRGWHGAGGSSGSGGGGGWVGGVWSWRWWSWRCVQQAWQPR